MTSETCDIENTITALEDAIKNIKNRMRNSQVKSFSVVSYFFSEVLNRAGGSYAQMTKALEHGREFAQNFINTARQNIQHRPWEVLRKVAVCSFGIGLFLSLRHRKSPARKKE